MRTTLVPTGGFVFMVGVLGRKMACASYFVLEGSPHDPCPSGPHSEMSKSFSLLSASNIFQTAASSLYLCGLFVQLSLQGWGLSFLFPSGLS